MTEPHHRLQCTAAQFRTYLAIIDYVKNDGEYDDFPGLFAVDEKHRHITADRISWGRFRDGASAIYAAHVEKEMVTDQQRRRDILAMLNDKACEVAGPFVPEKPARPKQMAMFGDEG